MRTSGVATEPGSRGQGLSTACAGAVCQDVRDRGRIPSWTTSPDNTASLRVAAKLGFTVRPPRPAAGRRRPDPLGAGHAWGRSNQDW